MGRWQDGRGKLIVHGEREGFAVPLEIASSYRARTKGLLGRDSVDGALLLSPRAVCTPSGCASPSTSPTSTAGSASSPYAR